MSDSLLRLLGVKNALDELIRTQAMALDLCDWAAYRSCFADSIHFDFAEHIERVTGNRAGVITNPGQWIEMSQAVIPGFDSTMHVTSGPVHEIEGSRASTRCYITADHFLDGQSVTVGGLYRIDSTNASGQWKIAGLALQVFFYRGDPTLYRRAADRVRAGQARR